MSKRITWRSLAAVGIVSLTVVVFGFYFTHHPEVRHQLSQLSAGTLVILVGLYILFTGSLALINLAALKLCDVPLKAAESLLITMYSAVINFFGPLQSGPAFRALYLKQKHGVSIAAYTSASFTYYFFYAMYSGLLLVSGIFKWWLVPVTLIIFFGIYWLAKHPDWRPLKRLALEHWPYMAAATFCQVFLLVIIFYIELHAVSSGVSLSQVLVYTGAANLALFVSLTPGAIGFRESFLVFSSNLHHISNSTIVAANLIDRTVYISLLAIIAVVIFATHANRQLRLKVSN